MKGIEITKWRKAKNLKKTELAGRLKISTRTLMRAEQAETVSKSVAEAFDAHRTTKGLTVIREEIQLMTGDDQ